MQCSERVTKASQHYRAEVVGAYIISLNVSHAVSHLLGLSAILTKSSSVD